MSYQAHRQLQLPSRPCVSISQSVCLAQKLFALQVSPSSLKNVKEFVSYEDRNFLLKGSVGRSNQQGSIEAQERLYVMKVLNSVTSKWKHFLNITSDVLNFLPRTTPELQCPVPQTSMFGTKFVLCRVQKKECQAMNNDVQPRCSSHDQEIAEGIKLVECGYDYGVNIGSGHSGDNGHGVDDGHGHGVDIGRGHGVDIGRGHGVDIGRGQGGDDGHGVDDGHSHGVDIGRGHGVDIGRGQGGDDGHGVGHGHGVDIGRGHGGNDGHGHGGDNEHGGDDGHGHGIDNGDDDDDNNEVCAVLLFTFVHGDLLCDVKWNRELLIDFGTKIAYMHQAMKKFSQSKHYLDQIENKDFIWDLRNMPVSIRHYCHGIEDEDKRIRVQEIVQGLQESVLPKLKNLEAQLIHGDINEHNVIVRPDANGQIEVKGFIDFGDLQHSYRVLDVAIAMAYSMMESANHGMNPIQASGHVLSGYQSEFPLSSLEIDMLLVSAMARISQSLAMGAYTYKYLSPDNEYILYTAKHGWKVLDELQSLPQQHILDIWKSLDCMRKQDLSNMIK